MIGTRRALLGGRVAESPAARAARYGLVSAWNGEDAADSFGANTLTPVNSPTFTAGKLGNAFTLAGASSQYLTLASNATVQTGDIDWWWSGWINGTTLADREIYTKYGAAPEFEIQIASTRAKIYIYDAVSANKNVTATTFGVLSTGTFYHVFVYNDSVNDVLGICVNGGAFDTVSTAAFVPAATAAPVNVGNYNNNPAGAFWNGQLDALAFGKNPPGGIATLANEIRDYHYNAGTGRQW